MNMIRKVSENELLERIKKIEKRLARMEKEAKVGLEDQLFFGLVVSLAIFIITLPLTDLVVFFQSVIRLDYSVAMNLSDSVRNTAIACLVLSILLRYYGAIKPHKGSRLLSFLCLMVSLDFFLLIFLPSITLNFAVEVRVVAFPLSHSLLFIIYTLIGRFVERRIILFYAKRGFVLKRYAKPLVSFAFATLSACLYVTLIVQLFHFILFNTVLSDFQYWLTYTLSFFFLVVIGYLLFLRREKIVRF